MNKKGLLGMILLIIVGVLVIGGALFYFQLKSDGVQISSGDLQVDISLDSSLPTDDEISLNPPIEEESNESKNQTNITITELNPEE